jgi:hypothetical protein
MAKDETHEHQVSINLDTTPILYTDSVSMNTNEDGVVLDVMQRVGSTNQMKIVSRIGMSRAHAKKLVESLGKLLLITEGSKQTSGKKN